MKFTDVMRQGKKWVKGQFYVRSVSAPEETREGGFCQAVQAVDTVGIEECLNYFCTDTQLEIKQNEVGKQWYEVRWIQEKGYYQCKPTDPPAPIWTDDEQPDWFKINLGKCRHGIMIAMLSAKLNPFDIVNDQTLRDVINKLAYFSMTGGLEDETRND